MGRDDGRLRVGEGARRKSLRRSLLALPALSLAAELAVHLHPRFAFEAVFGFAAWLGLAACIVLVVVAGAVARLLGRPDDYHGNAPDA
jgi:hypothetical protein